MHRSKAARRDLPAHINKKAQLTPCLKSKAWLLIGARLLQSGIGCYGFGCCKIAGYRVLVYGIDHHLKQVVLASSIELKRLVDGAVFLLHLLVVSQHVE